MGGDSILAKILEVAFFPCHKKGKENVFFWSGAQPE